MICVSIPQTTLSGDKYGSLTRTMEPHKTEPQSNRLKPISGTIDTGSSPAVMSFGACRLKENFKIIDTCFGIVYKNVDNLNIIYVQFLKEKEFKQTTPQVKIEDSEEISCEKATTTLRRCVSFFAALQASDGHWPAENAGPLYFIQPLVICMYITNHLDVVFPEEYRKEILRLSLIHI